jgi:hypothetical protein
VGLFADVGGSSEGSGGKLADSCTYKMLPSNLAMEEMRIGRVAE